MSKSKWIKSGPHKGKRSPHGGPAKTARGSYGEHSLNRLISESASCGGRFKVEEVKLLHICSGDRPPRGMQ